MKKLFLLLLLMLPFCCIAQNNGESNLRITLDSLNGNNFLSLSLGKHWRFHNGDSATFAELAFNDSNWHLTDAFSKTFNDDDLTAKDTNSVTWFRLHLNIDSSLEVTPMALHVMGFGAFEVYIDGK